jgi:hypothetical protein
LFDILFEFGFRPVELYLKHGVGSWSNKKASPDAIGLSSEIKNAAINELISLIPALEKLDKV